MLPPGFDELEIPRSAMLRKIKAAADGRALQKDAKLAISRAAVLFVSYLTAAAREVAGAKRTTTVGTPTITLAHVLEALHAIGMGDEMAEAARLRVEEHRVAMAERARRRAESAAAEDSAVSDADVDDSDDDASSPEETARTALDAPMAADD